MKQFLKAEDLLTDSFMLGRAVFDSGWKPDVLVALWRGGAPIGLAVHEYFSYKGWSVEHQVVKCSSYTGIEAHSDKVTVDYASQVFSSFKPGSKALILDDIYDSGNTFRTIQRMIPKTVETRFATVYAKIPLSPSATLDYWVHKTNSWVVFPHEVQGLTKQELETKNATLASIISGISKHETHRPA